MLSDFKVPKYDCLMASHYLIVTTIIKLKEILRMLTLAFLVSISTIILFQIMHCLILYLQTLMTYVFLYQIIPWSLLITIIPHLTYILI
jgi:hypothetical protein